MRIGVVLRVRLIAGAGRPGRTKKDGKTTRRRVQPSTITPCVPPATSHGASTHATARDTARPPSAVRNSQARRPGRRGATHAGPLRRHDLQRHRSHARAQPHSINAGGKATSSHTAMRASRGDAPARARPGACVPRAWRRGRAPTKQQTAEPTAHRTRAGSPHHLHPEPHDKQPTARTPHLSTATNPSADAEHKQPRSELHRPRGAANKQQS